MHRPNEQVLVTGSLSLDDVGKRHRMLEVRCGNCPRSGRLRIDKLIDEYGRDMSLPDLRTILAVDCELIPEDGRDGPPGCASSLSYLVRFILRRSPIGRFHEVASDFEARRDAMKALSLAFEGRECQF